MTKVFVLVFDGAFPVIEVYNNRDLALEQAWWWITKFCTDNVLNDPDLDLFKMTIFYGFRVSSGHMATIYEREIVQEAFNGVNLK